MSEGTDHARTLEYMLEGSPGLKPHEIEAVNAGIAALEASEARVKELEAQVKDLKCEQVFRISEMQELVEAQQRIAELEAGIEWEYQCTNNINTTGPLDDPELHAKQCAGRIERRRPAGPWLPVEGEKP